MKRQANISEKEIEEIKAYAVGIEVDFDSLNKKYIDEVRNNDLLLHAYTVNEYSDFEKMKKWGVNGVFTDFLNIKE